MNNPTPDTRKRPLRFAPFALALICFALPFLEVSCQGQKAGAMTGIQLALGTEVPQSDPFTGRTSTKQIEGEKIFLGALVGTALVSLLSLVPGSTGLFYAVLGGLINFGVLIAGKMKLEADLARQGGEAVVCHWQLGYWVACVLLIIGVLVAGRQMAEEKKNSAYKPPVVT